MKTALGLAVIIMVFLATIVCAIIILTISLQLSEPIKSLMESEAWRFRGEVFIYICTLSLALYMPFFCVIEMIQGITSEREEYRWFMPIVLFLVAFLSYPLLAHAVTTIGVSGLDLVQFKESVSTMLDFRNTEPGWYSNWYGIALCSYGLTVRVALAFGLVLCVLVLIMCTWGCVLFFLVWVWAKSVKLAVNFYEG